MYDSVFVLSITLRIQSKIKKSIQVFTFLGSNLKITRAFKLSLHCNLIHSDEIT